MLTLKESMGMVLPYAKKRIIEQVKSVWLIVLYLIAFQTIILGTPIQDAGVVAVALCFVIVGLTFFMEGLLLGLMPLGEDLGLKLPQKSSLPLILLFSFILGMGATFAEPAIGVLKLAGSSVRAWEAPLLFVLLNKASDQLVYSVGVGVGLAVIFGMLRFMYGWSLKPFIYLTIGLTSILAVWGIFDPNVQALSGLAWDCGAVTTGPVTVPLVIALGIGICRVVSKGESEGGGFGVVTLASIFPIIAVYGLGAFYLSSVPAPTTFDEFAAENNKAKYSALFSNVDEFEAYKAEQLNAKNVTSATSNANAIKNAGIDFSKYLASVQTQAAAALQAIIPLSLFLLFFLVVVLRDRVRRVDEMALGIVFAVAGMWIFNVGIEFGLSKIGDQVGSTLPAAYKSLPNESENLVVKDFDEKLINKAVDANGVEKSFFYTWSDNEPKAISFQEGNLDRSTNTYRSFGAIGPLFGKGEGNLFGIFVVLLFAFVMGYGATLAEPALNALGTTVEEITVGTFKKSLLMQAVAIGVGMGITLGVSKIIWNIPLAYLLIPPYLLLVVITYLSSEEFVNIGWDSAGVTTGPITVPLVLAMGIGIGSQAGVVEGFGILSMASVCPILSVLSVGLYVSRKRKALHSEKENSLPKNNEKSTLSKAA